MKALTISDKDWELLQKLLQRDSLVGDTNRELLSRIGVRGEFLITCVSRDDLAGLHHNGEPVYTEEFCNTIPDDVMERISAKMADAYMGIYWIDLEIIAEQVLREAGLTPETTETEDAL